MMAIFGALIPRFVLLVAWSNDATYWAQTLFGGPVLFLGGFLFFPWTTLIYGLVQTQRSQHPEPDLHRRGVPDRPRDLGHRRLRDQAEDRLIHGLVSETCFAQPA